MSKIYSILKFAAVVVFMVLFSAKTANSQYFLKSYDMVPFTTKTEMGRSIEQSGTSNWVVAGFTNGTPSPGGYDWLFQKINSAGVPVVTKQLGFGSDDSCFSNVVLNSSLNNVLSGFYRPGANLREKASWSMLDSNGIHLMTKTISDTLRHQYRGVTKNPTTNNFTNAGWIEDFISGLAFRPNKIMATNYTSAGTMAWGWKYVHSTPSDDQAYSICYQPVDGSYGITGTTNLFTGPGGALQVFILKVNAAGMPVWFKVYNNSTPAAPSASRKIIAMSDGGFTVAGFTNAFDPTANDAWVLRVTPAGFPIFSNIYGFPGRSEEAHSIVLNTADASLIFTGHTSSSINEDILVCKISAVSGAPIWVRHCVNATGTDRGYDIELSPSTTGSIDFISTGRFDASLSLTTDSYLLKLDNTGKIPGGCIDTLVYSLRSLQISRVDSVQLQALPLSDVTYNPGVNTITPAIRDICAMTAITNNNTNANSFELKQNYPNPFNPVTNIEFSLPENGNVTVRVFDISGKEVATLVNGFKNKGSYSVNFDAASLSSGIYLYELKTENFTSTKKMMLIK